VPEPRRIARTVDLDAFTRIVRRSQERARELAGQLANAASTGEQSPLMTATDEWLAAVEELEVAEEELRQQNEELALTADAIRTEHARYEDLFQLAPDAYLVTDAAGAILEANRAAVSLLRVPGDFLQGKPLAVFIDPEDRRVFRACIDILGDNEHVVPWEMQLCPRYGPAAYVSVAASASRDPSGMVRSIRWIFRDVTEQRRVAERLRAINATVERRVGERTASIERAILDRDARIAVLEKELAAEQAARLEAEADGSRRADLLGMLSHEIRTPLHASLGYLELMEMSFGNTLAAEQRGYMNRMHQCQAYLVDVMEGMLHLSRLERGALDVELTDVSVDAALATVPALVQLAATQKGLRVEHRTGDPSVAVRADREKLQQIVLNLVTNAIKFTPAGGSITMSWEASPDTVSIRVDDTGHGIRPSDLERIFEPFVQGSVPRDVPHGVGFGLAISRQLARLMGGDLTASSTPGEGATFTLKLPRRAHT
jgi:PAS domain S-box-containing protein